MKLNFQDFVKDTIGEMDNFEKTNLTCIRQIVKKAIDFYEMKSFEEEEETLLGAAEFLHIHSMAEENLLSKIVEISMQSENFDVEGVYEGRVIREY